MNRKEIFEIIKKNGWNKEIRDTFGKNMTQVSNENLSMFIKDKSITEQAEKTNKKQEKEKERKKEEVKEEIPEEKTVVLEDVDTASEGVKKGISKVAFIELISILQAEACIKSKEAERILKLI